MTDRELLEAAAKAAGLKLNTYPGEDFVRADHSGLGTRWNPQWNPLESDGDALRLVVRLNMELSIDPRSAWAMAEDDLHAGKACEIGPDPCAATRRAIVRAAAAIGGAA